MAYTKTTWIDRVVEFANRYKDQNLVQYIFTKDPGTITAAGTALNAVALNNIEDGIKNIETAGASYPFTNMPFFDGAAIVAKGTGYVKFADGTMIQYGTKTITGLTCATALTGGGYRNTGAVSANEITFAESFYNTSYRVSCNLTSYNASSATTGSISKAVNKCYAFIMCVASTASIDVVMDYIAIGTWK
jgi:hypothetical protein